MGDHVGIPGVDLLSFYNILFQHFELIVMSRALLLSIILYHQVLLIHITQAGTLLNVKKRVSSTECCLAWFVLVQKYQYMQAHYCISFLENRASRIEVAWRGKKKKLLPPEDSNSGLRL